VGELAAQYGLPYVYDEGRLGQGESEAVAREARYAFLHKVRESSGAQAVVMAHHSDDVLETAILNIVRGTGRRGLTSLKSTDIVKRPLLHTPKADIIRYAQDNQLLWREDSTNASDAYKRNYVRHAILPRFSAGDRERLHEIIVGMRGSNVELDELLEQLIIDMSDQSSLRQSVFVMLPHVVAREVMATWLRLHKVDEIDKKMVERLVHAAKTFHDGKRVDVNRDWHLRVCKNYLALERTER
jgi:tRNA(Ile)-lysidine synthase TilS/MesJ